MVLLENSNVVTSDIEQETPKMFVNTLHIVVATESLSAMFSWETRDM